jgi:hypothetical protein
LGRARLDGCWLGIFCATQIGVQFAWSALDILPRILEPSPYNYIEYNTMLKPGPTPFDSNGTHVFGSDITPEKFIHKLPLPRQHFDPGPASKPIIQLNTQSQETGLMLFGGKFSRTHPAGSMQD